MAGKGGQQDCEEAQALPAHQISGLDSHRGSSVHQDWSSLRGPSNSWEFMQPFNGMNSLPVTEMQVLCLCCLSE